MKQIDFDKTNRYTSSQKENSLRFNIVYSYVLDRADSVSDFVFKNKSLVSEIFTFYNL